MFDDFFNVVKLRFNGSDEDETPSYKCPRCQSPIPLERFEELHRVCPNCNYHGRLSAAERIEITVDKDSFKELDPEMIVVAAYGKILPPYIIEYPKYGCCLKYPYIL